MPESMPNERTSAKRAAFVKITVALRHFGPSSTDSSSDKLNPYQCTVQSDDTAAVKPFSSCVVLQHRDYHIIQRSSVNVHRGDDTEQRNQSPCVVLQHRDYHIIQRSSVNVRQSTFIEATIQSSGNSPPVSCFNIVAIASSTSTSIEVPIQSSGTSPPVSCFNIVAIASSISTSIEVHFHNAPIH
ncbi:hypothetical protein K0M31_001611 [Melipona bicolor]|uniref:Uncharacterized protein n=1 Tax=Melipona bicolor TaxID=60889 RepID=A0AA40GG37_9HYME|nr:hypothetical protein K0M31_001611 [Melipona bicolor]